MVFSSRRLPRLMLTATCLALLAACTTDHSDNTPKKRQGLPTAFALLSDNSVIQIWLGVEAKTRRRVLAPPSPNPVPGHYFAASKQGHSLFVLTSGGGSRSATLFALDPITLRTKDRYTLPAGVEFRSLAVGPKTGDLYLFGNRAGSRLNEVGYPEQDVIVGVINPQDEALTVTTVRSARGRDWLVYRGVVSADERRLFISYHGSDTTGADFLRISGKRLSRCTVKTRPGQGCIGDVHGNIEAYGAGIVASTGDSHVILQFDRDGRMTRLWRTKLRTHLVEFAVDRQSRRLYAIGSCNQSGGLSEIDTLAESARVVVPPSSQSGVCGERLAVSPDAVLALTNIEVPVFPEIPGAVRFINGEKGTLIRSVPTPSGPLDVLIEPQFGS